MLIILGVSGWVCSNPEIRRGNKPRSGIRDLQDTHSDRTTYTGTSDNTPTINPDQKEKIHM